MGENIVNMNPVNQEEKKLSYEELEQAAQSISAQYQNLLTKSKELAAKYQELVQNNYFIRLDWLYRVIHSDKFPESFINKCVAEFISMMAPEKEEEESDN